MVYVRSISPQEAKEIAKRMQKSNKTTVYIRFKTIELSSQRKSVTEIAKLLSRHPNSIRSYLHRFNQGGIEALMPKWKGGAPQKLKDLDQEYFEDLLGRPPSHFKELKSQSQNWTYELMQQYLSIYEKREVHQNTIWFHLRRIKYTSGRSKLSITSPDPDYKLKRQRVEEVEKKAI